MAGENINRRLNIYINDREIVNSSRGIEREMARVRNEIRNLNRGAADYDQQLDRLRDTYSQLQQQQQRFRNDMAQTKGILDRIKTSLGPIATGFLTAFSVTTVISKVTTGLQNAWRQVVEFDQKQANLAAVMGKTRTQIAGLTADAIKYGASSVYSANQVSELQSELAKLGKTAPEIKAMTKDVLNAATALETDLSSAAVLVGGQLNSYGENANQAGKYSDIMANSVNISATSYEYLATSLPKVSAVAAQNNVTFEALNATMGVLADQNVAAETAGTGFRNILLESAKEGRNYKDMLNDVSKSTDQTKRAVELFGKENATVAVILANSTQKLEDNTKALENSAGAAEALAKEKLNSIKGSIEAFSGAWEGFILSMEKGDGIIAKSIRGVVDLGTSFLELITPMKRVSDQLKEEQLELNMLVSKITSSNISNEERKRLLVQLKNEYPDFIKNIDIETVSNEQLNSTLNKVNEQYVKRIALQKQVENVEDAQKESGQWVAERLKAQDKLFELLNENKTKYSLKIPIDYNDLQGSAAKVKKMLEARNVEGGFFGDIKGINTFLSQIKAYDAAIAKSNIELDEQTKILDRQQKSLGINTEAQNENNRALAEQQEILKKLRAEAKGFGMANADKATEQELKVWIAAYKEKLKLNGELSEEEKKKRAKELEEARKHSDELLKEFQNSQKELLEAQRSYQDLSIQGQKENYERERQELIISYDRKIEDIRNKEKEVQAEIDKLQVELKDPKNSKSDVALLQKQITNKLELQKTYNDTAVLLEQTKTFKLAALNEKYLQKEFTLQEEAFKRQLQNLETKQNFELASITDLESAKAFLQDKISSDELSKIQTLEQAKTAIKEQQAKEQFEIQKDYLEKVIEQYSTLLELDAMSGFQLLSDEERDATIKNLEQINNELSKLFVKKSDDDSKDLQPEQKFTSGLDVLGFSPEQWQVAFDNIDTWSEKLQAVTMVVGAVQNAFGQYFKFLEAGEARNIKKFEQNNKKKTRDLEEQLKRGYITQEVFDARKEKLDIELDKKRAEIEYKQAKRQKAMQIAQVISSTALAIMGIWRDFPKVDFGATASIMSGVVGALGAAQLATIMRQPLPSKNGFRDGGYTGDGPDTGVAGDVHFGEFVTPKKVLMSDDPLVPAIVGYLEAKRTGKVTASSSSGDYASPQQTVTSSENLALQQKTNDSLDRLNVWLEKLEEGIPAYLENDLKTAKKIRRKLKELETLENQTKL